MLFTLAVITAFMTAFYMFRLFFMIFSGEARGNGKDVHESPSIMTIPMMVLALLAIVAGYINTPWFGTFLGDWLLEGNPALGDSHVEGPSWIMILATVLSLLGIFLAWLMYGKKSLSRDWLSSKMPLVVSVLQNKYFIDELYQYTVVYVNKSMEFVPSIYGMVHCGRNRKRNHGFHSITSKTRSQNCKMGKLKVMESLPLLA